MLDELPKYRLHRVHGPKFISVVEVFILTGQVPWIWALKITVL